MFRPINGPHCSRPAQKFFLPTGTRRQSFQVDNAAGPPVTPNCALIVPAMASLTAAMAPLTRRTAATALRPCIRSPSYVGSQFARPYSVPSKAKMVREYKKIGKEGSKATEKESMSQMQRRANLDYFKRGGPLFPGTFIALPISKYPRAPSAFLRYQWYRAKTWAVEVLSLLNMKLKSMPNWTTRPQWKVGRGKIAPTAKVMYTEMLSAFAAGDKSTIQNLCLGNFAQKLSAAIDRRNPREKVVFELVKFNKTLFYPRAAAHQVHQFNPYDKDMVTEQAVVAIASQQRAYKTDATTGEDVPGSLKVHDDKIEYVVMSRQMNQKTFQAEPWKIWGTVPATTMEAYQKEQEAINHEMAKRSGWKDSPAK